MSEQQSTFSLRRADDSYARRNGERLARIETALDALNKRIDDVIIGQVKDHGKRLAVLENRGHWMAGWIAGAGAVGGVVAFILQKLF